MCDKIKNIHLRVITIYDYQIGLIRVAQISLYDAIVR